MYVCIHIWGGGGGQAPSSPPPPPPTAQIRMKTNPVTDGKAKFKPAPDQAVISPTGSMVTHWFRKVLGNPDLGSVYFMGSRNGMGTSWFMQTNALKYVNSFTFSFQVALAPNLLILQKQVSGLCKSDCGNL